MNHRCENPHAQPKGKMNTGHSTTIFIDGNELALWKDLSMIFKFLDGVWLLGGVNHPANLDNGLVMCGFNETDSIIGWKQVRLLFSS